MASVRKRGNSQFWYACYKMPTGQVDSLGRPIYARKHRSTGQTDKSVALQLAIAFEKAAVIAAEKRWLDDTGRRFLAELHALAGTPIAHVETTQDFLRRWLAGRRPSLAIRSVENYEKAIESLITFLGAGSTAPVSSISAALIARFRDAEVAAGKGPSTVNKFLMVLGQAFDEAVTLGALERNPARGLNVKGEHRARQTRRPFTFEQFRALVNATTDDWRTFIITCGYTAGRQQEIAQLDWSRTDVKRGLLSFDRTKNLDEHCLPMHRTLRDHLKQIWRSAGQPTRGPVMPELAKLQRRAISNNFRRAILPRIGISQAYSQAENRGKGRRLAPYSIHSLRHSLTTWLRAAGVEEVVRMRIAGHEDKQVNRGYTHTELHALAHELAKVPAL